MEYNLRLATEDDDLRIVEKLKEAQQEGPYKSNQSFSEKRALEVLQHIRRQGKQYGIALLAESPSGEILGLFGAIVTYSSFSLDPLAAEMLWWVSPKARKTRLAFTLLDAFEVWADKLGVSKLVLGSMENEHSEAIDRLYKRRGYELTERTYFKELKNGSRN